MIKPNLRFKEFSHDWENVKLGDIFKVNQGLAIKIENRFVEYETGMYKYITHKYLNGKEKCFYIKAPSQSVICNKNDILMTRTGNTGVVITNVEGVFHNNFFKIDFDRKVHFKEFIYYILTSKKMQSNILSLAGTSTIPDLNHGDFYSIQSSIPTLAEQEKIGKFLTLIDKRINLLTTQKSKLEDYKKTLSTKLLTQEIRFKGFSDDWQTVNLGDISDVKTSSVDKLSKLGEKQALLLNYMDVYNNYYIDQSIEYQKITAKEQHFISSNIKKGDIFLTPSSETPIDIGRPAIALEDLTNVLFSYHLVRIRIKNNYDYCIKFMPYVLSSQKIRKQLYKYAQGATRFTLSLKNIENIQIQIPTIAEQEKIARVLSNIDKLIERKQTSLTQTITYKKYLLQNMFV